MATSPSATSAVPKILAAYVDGLKMKSLSAPNEQTKARIGKAIKKLLNEGDRDGIVYTPEEIIECLKNWFASTYAWVVKTDFKFAAFKSMLSQLKAGPLVNYSKGGRHNEPTVGEDFTKYNPKIHAGRFKADNE